MSKFIKIAFFFFIGILLIWWSLHQIPAEEWTKFTLALKDSKLWIVFPVFIILGLSHFLRALRWRLIMEPLGYKPSIGNTYFAVLIGLGATAIYPFLAYETVEQLVEKGNIPLTARQAVLNYRKGINKGLYKIMSKMGISTVASYRCSNLFEAVGINQNVMKLCFPDLPSRIQGADFADFQQDVQQRANSAWLKRKPLNHGGQLKYVHDGEYHAYNPDVVQSLQKAVRSGKYADYKVYSDFVNQRPVAHLRDLFSLNKANATPVDLEQVQAAEQLYPRFDSAAMSIGALSPYSPRDFLACEVQIRGFSHMCAITFAPSGSTQKNSWCWPNGG